MDGMLALGGLAAALKGRWRLFRLFLQEAAAVSTCSWVFDNAAAQVLSNMHLAARGPASGMYSHERGQVAYLELPQRSHVRAMRLLGLLSQSSRTCSCSVQVCWGESQ